MGKVYCVFRDDPPPVDGEMGLGECKLVDLATGQEVIILFVFLFCDLRLCRYKINFIGFD